jgi:dolichyl-diphosphooligosaccharide--protein glycosyltransferase
VLSWVQVALALVCLLGYQLIYADFRATPVLAPPHAEALMTLKNIAPKDAWIWTWWDFGYATQYYAERMTPTDGGKHTGRDIFATALALSTPSYRQAAQVILLSAAWDNEPARRWDKLPAREVRQELATLAQADVPLKRAAPQYLVVCWENLSLLYWMTYYGSWDVVSGSGTHARRQDILEPFNVDQNRGVMVFRGPSAPIAIQSVDQLSTQGARRLSFAVNPAAPHLLINEITHQVMLMDDLAYNSMAVQLLIGDPARPEQSRYFKLVHEGFPLVRIYEVLPPAQEPKGQAEAFTQ